MTKLEEIARVIWNVAPEGGRTLLPFGVHPETERCIKQARVAMEAAQKLSVARTKVGRDMWHAMIDEILNEKEPA